MTGINEKIPGLIVTLLIAFIAFLAGSLHPSFEVLVISMIFGMLVSSIVGEKAVLEPGIDMALKIFLPLGVALYGLQLKTSGTPLKLWPTGILAFAVIFLTTYLISKAFGIGKNITLLLSSGMAICGASAIVVIAHLIRAKREEVSVSLISVLMVGLTGMLAYKFIFPMANTSLEKAAFLTGMTLPMMGQVKIIASSLGQNASLALTLKLIRVAHLLVLSCAILLILGRDRKRVHLPWFMVAFFALAIAGNLSDYIGSLRKTFEPIGSFILASALSAIGLSIDIDTVTDNGPRPLICAFLSWAIVVSVFFIALSVMNV